MIRHIVLLELTEGSTGEDRAAITDALATLPGRIDSIAGYSIGTDLGLGPGNAHIAVVAEFDDVAGWETYRDHEAHRAVIDRYITPVLARRTAIQCQL